MITMLCAQPLCLTHACCHNDPNYPNNCAISTSVEGCALAQIYRPNHAQKTLAWIDAHWLGVGLAIAALSIIMGCAMLIYGAGARAAIEHLRTETTAAIQAAILPDEQFRQLHRKHGYPVVIFQRGQQPYYINQNGQRCLFA